MLEGRLHRVGRVPLAPEAAAEVEPRERAPLERPKRGTVGSLFIDCRGEPFPQLGADDETGRETLEPAVS